MARKLSVVASRDAGVWLFRLSVLAFAGVTGGILLGEMAAGTRLGNRAGEPASYSHLSANPDALVPQGGEAAPCPGCANSYGVALRLRAHRDERMGDEFRNLGAVDVDPPILADADDDYRYGGRFADPEPGAAVTSEGPDAIMSASDSSLSDKITPVPAEY